LSTAIQGGVTAGRRKLYAIFVLVISWSCKSNKKAD